jgi:glycosyl hydrolase family 44
MRAAITRLVGAMAGTTGPILVIVAAGCADHTPVAPHETPTASAERAQVSGASAVTFSINTGSTHPISRFIYGINFLTEVGGPYVGRSPWYGASLPAGVTLNRMGGNRMTAYNWENNFSNAGSDYNYENDNYLDQSTAPGHAVGARVTATLARGAAMIVTVPMLGYVAADQAGPLDTRDADRAHRLAAHFKVSVPAKGAAFTLTPSTRNAHVYQDEFVNWVKTKFPTASTNAATPIFYSLDNEPDDWHLTHQEIQSNYHDNPNTPRLQTYNGYIDTAILYARAIKKVVPNALVFGPAVATYAGVLTLGRYPTPDPVYGTRSFLDIYLDRLNGAAMKYGERLVDVLDLHWYPAAGAGSNEITNDYATQSGAMVRARVQAPRSLWDPSYDERSWVSSTTGGPVKLLPRLQSEIAAHYPGTKLAITEYYYGRAGDISGGVAQADVLGIFGKYGVFAATLWPQAGVWAAPYGGSGAKAYAYGFGAFSMFLNYDGAGGRFGDVGLAATTSDSVNTSVYASRDAAGRIVVVAINKNSGPTLATIKVGTSVALRTAQVYRMVAGSPSPVRQAAFSVSSRKTLSYTMPGMSVSTLVLSN